MIFITQGRYTQQGMTGLTQKPEDRAKAIKPMIEAAGGRLISFYFTFGEYDFLLITEGSSEKDLAKALIVTSLSGTITDLKTTLAISSSDAVGIFSGVAEIAKSFRPAGT